MHLELREIRRNVQWGTSNIFETQVSCKLMVRSHCVMRDFFTGLHDLTKNTHRTPRILKRNSSYVYETRYSCKFYVYGNALSNPGTPIFYNRPLRVSYNRLVRPPWLIKVFFRISSRYKWKPTENFWSTERIPSKLVCFETRVSCNLLV